MKKRKTVITRNYLIHPIGSVLIETGNTKVICTVTAEENIPPFLRVADPPQGWLTTEYSMLPGASNQRFQRERSKINSRSTEIQRMIGRALRAVVDLSKFPGITLTVDCDVLQADGGTRTAAITGACVALYDAFTRLQKDDVIDENPLKELIAAVSVGIVDGEIMLDLDYEADSRAEVDMNIVMTESGKFVEIQGTAEKEPFDDDRLKQMLKAAKSGILQLFKEQRKALAK